MVGRHGYDKVVGTSVRGADLSAMQLERVPWRAIVIQLSDPLRIRHIGEKDSPAVVKV